MVNLISSIHIFFITRREEGFGRQASDSTPCRPKRSPFVLFWGIHFWLTDLKFLIRATLEPIYTNFVWGVHTEKKINCLAIIFKKLPKKHLFMAWFSKICLRCIKNLKFGRVKFFIVILEKSKNCLVDLKKNGQKIQKNFETYPGENPVTSVTSVMSMNFMWQVQSMVESYQGKCSMHKKYFRFWIWNNN